ncbi:MAG TPA: hypothetical protein VII76_10725 [Acidimicrobiales bacterium]
MPTSTRALPFVLLGAFTILVAGGVALSLSSAQPLAEEQLRMAAQTTMSASGFILKDINSVTTVTSPGASAAGGAPVGTVAFLVVYQAPTSVEETEVDRNGGNASVIVVGDRGFRKTGSQWTELAATTGLGARAVGTIMSPLRGAAGATGVSRRGDRYRFSPADLHQLLRTVLGVTTSRLSSPQLTAVVRDGAVTGEVITAVVGRQRLEVDLAFSAIGSAPPVKAPRSFVAAAG